MSSLININNDNNRINRFNQEDIKIFKQSKFNYKSKKNQNISESRNNIEEAEEISILIKNVNEWDIIENLLKKYGYVVTISFSKYINSIGIPTNIFINLKSGKITHAVMIYEQDWIKSYTFNGVWEKILTIKDVPLIERILKTGVIIRSTPSYEPRKIKRLEESINLPNYMSDDPPILTPSEQRELYKIGDIVIVRPDAFDYFNDVCEYNMSKYFGKKVKIVDLCTVEEVYEDDTSKYNGMSPDDLLITVVSADDSIPSVDRWYWSYRCLFSFKKIKPNYNPRKIERSIDESFDFRVLPKISPILTQSQQQEQYKKDDIVIIRPDAFDYFSDTNDYMKECLGKKAIIKYISTVGEVYDNKHINICKESKPDDLLLELEIENSDEPQYSYYYRCLFNPNFAIPSYNPKKINKSILEDIKNSFRIDYHIEPIKYQEKFNKISPPIISIKDIEEYYDIKFEKYVNDLYSKLNENIEEEQQRELMKKQLKKGKYDCLLFNISEDEKDKVFDYLKKLGIINTDRFFCNELKYVILTKNDYSLVAFELYTYNNIGDIREHMERNWSMLENISPVWTFDEFKNYIDTILIKPAMYMYAPRKINRSI